MPRPLLVTSDLLSDVERVSMEELSDALENLESQLPVERWSLSDQELMKIRKLESCPLIADHQVPASLASSMFTPTEGEDVGELRLRAKALLIAGRLAFVEQTTSKLEKIRSGIN